MSNKKNNPKRYEEIHFVDTAQPVWNYSLFDEEVIANFQRGTLYNAYTYFGNKQLIVLNKQGTYFAVWAPNATQVSIVGNFNDWKMELTSCLSDWIEVGYGKVLFLIAIRVKCISILYTVLTVN